jgi:protein SCO1/2
LNGQVSPELAFRDESGGAVRLGDYLRGKPVVLVLGYYQCPMLCNLVLNGLVDSLQDMKWSVGRDFDMVNVSIDPSETPALAAAKKLSYIRRYGRTGAEGGWHFLTGEKGPIDQLAGQVGFHYAYDAPSRQYAHPSGFVILTPQGRVARYFFGVSFSAPELYKALADASGNKVSSPIQRLVLLCFHYNPVTGKYGPVILLVVRSLSVATLAALIWLIVALSRRPVAIAASVETTAATTAPHPTPPEL